MNKKKSTKVETGISIEVEEADLADLISESPRDGIYTEQSAFKTEELEEIQFLFLEEQAPILDEDEFEIISADGPANGDFLQDSELANYETAEIEDLEFVEDERVESVVESVLFATDKPVTLNALRQIFKGTQVKTDKIKKAVEKLSVFYAGGNRGIYIEEVQGGYQLRTKLDNMDFLRRTLKTKPFRLSGPALEVLAIVAYKQPLIKHEIDEIRGVESGHLLRALMEKSIVAFAGKSDLPGKPMQYVTTKKFLEIFGLRNLKELPTLSQIDELLPEGINEDDEVKNSKLSSITDSLSQQIALGGYSEGEEELFKITEQLGEITTSSDFFEQEKQRQKEKKDFEKAQDIRDALEVKEAVSTRDLNWLRKYDEALASGKKSIDEKTEVVGLGQPNNATELRMEIIESEMSIDFEEKEEELPIAATDEELEGF